MYEIKIQVRYSETNPDGCVRLHQILDYFQDVATFQSMSLGLKTGGDYFSQHAWYLLCWDTTVLRYPGIGEYIGVMTQPYKMKGFYGYRRFFIRDSKGELIAFADSIWVLMNVERRIPVRISNELKQMFIDPDADGTVKIKRKIPLEGDWKKRESFKITDIFLDSNMHVNNVYYVQWAQSIIPDSSCVKRLRADYRQAALKGDEIRIYYCVNEDEALYRVKYINQDDTLIALVDMYVTKELFMGGTKVSRSSVKK